MGEKADYDESKLKNGFMGIDIGLLGKFVKCGFESSRHIRRSFFRIPKTICGYHLKIADRNLL